VESLKGVGNFERRLYGAPLRSGDGSRSASEAAGVVPALMQP